MDSVLQVFKLLIVLLLLSSCSTINREVEPINKIINITPKQSSKFEESKKDKTSITLTKAETIITGSISTVSRFGSDLWIGKLGGSLLRYNLYTGDITQFSDDVYSIKDYSIKKIITTKDKIIALQSDRLITINKNNEKLSVTLLPSNISRASDITIYKDKIYISTLGFGAWEYQPKEKSFKDFVSDIKYISSILVHNNTLYIGSMDNGLYEYDLIKKIFKSRIYYPLALFRKNIVKMETQNKILWLGTAKQGLIKWNMEENSIKRLYKEESVSSIYLGENSKNAVTFIGSGIYIENNDRASFESIYTLLKTNNVTSISIFNNSIISGNIKKGLIRQEITFLND